jgi:hypothetical protein
MLLFSAANFKPSSEKLVRDYYNKSKGTRVRLLIRVLCVYASLYTFDARVTKTPSLYTNVRVMTNVL